MPAVTVSTKFTQNAVIAEYVAVWEVSIKVGDIPVVQCALGAGLSVASRVTVA